MSRKRVNVKVIIYSLIFLIGGTFTIATISVMDYPYYYSDLEYRESYPFILTISSDAPQWNHTLDDIFASRIGITTLETNDTEINVLFLNSDSEVLMSLINVTEIKATTISITVSGETTIAVERVSGDASVTLTAVLTLELPPPPTAIPNPWPGIFFSSFIALLGFLLLVSVRIRHTGQATSRWMALRRVQTYWIALLILLGLILIAPHISGTLDRLFIPREQTEYLDSGSRTLIIDLSSPTENLEFSAGSIETSSYNFSVSCHLITGMKCGVSIQDGLGSNLFEAVVNSSVPWLIEGGMTHGADYTLSIERADYDAEVGFYFQVTRNYLGPDANPTISTVLAITGMGVLFVALFLGGIIESHDETQDS